METTRRRALVWREQSDEGAWKLCRVSLEKSKERGLIGKGRKTSAWGKWCLFHKMLKITEDF